MCDHFDIGPPTRSKAHGGRLPAEHIARYEQRLGALREAPWAAHIELLRLQSWHGFGHACRAGLEMVSTPLVFVVQHDMAFRRRVELTPLARLLLARRTLPAATRELPPCDEGGSVRGAPRKQQSCKEGREEGREEGTGVAPLHFVGLLKHATVNYRHRMRSRHNIDVGAPVLFNSVPVRPVPAVEPAPAVGDAAAAPPDTAEEAAGAAEPSAADGATPATTVALTRMPQFYDCAHLAVSDWYRTLFLRPLLNGAAIGERTRGEFTENNLGLHMLKLATARPELDKGGRASQGVLAVCAEFGGWLYDDGGPSMLTHLDGRKFLSAAEREARGIAPVDLRYKVCAGLGALGVGDMVGGSEPDRSALHLPAAKASSGS